MITSKGHPLALTGVIQKKTKQCLTVKAVYPSSTRMFLAQLLMCLKRSGPNKIPPYHRDTITNTLRTSRICNWKKNTCKISVNLGDWIGDKYAKVTHQLSSETEYFTPNVLKCIDCFCLNCQSKAACLTVTNLRGVSQFCYHKWEAALPSNLCGLYMR